MLKFIASFNFCHYGGPEAKIYVSAKQLIATANSLLEAANHLQPSSSLPPSSRPGSAVPSHAHGQQPGSFSTAGTSSGSSIAMGSTGLGGK